MEEPQLEPVAETAEVEEEPAVDAEEIAEEIVRPSPPGIPIVHQYRSFLTNYRARPDGGMDIIFTPAAVGPTGTMAMPPQLVFTLPGGSWESFKAEIAANGVKAERPAQPVVARQRIVLPDQLRPKGGV